MTSGLQSKKQSADTGTGRAGGQPTILILHALFGVSRASELNRLWPGVLLAAAVMLAALPLADRLGRWALRLQGIDSPTAGSPISGVLVAIVIGILLRNLLPLPAAVQPGIRFSVAKLLRLGIIFVGIKLSLIEVVRLGAWGLPVVLTTITAGLLFVSWLARRVGISDRLGTLIAAGTSICGITAIVSTAPAIDADESEVAYAVANIAFFGMLGMFSYPYLAARIFVTPEQVGLFLGTAVHDTSQVIGAGLSYQEMFQDEIAFKAATVTKLTRNLFLAAVVPLLAILYARRQARRTGSATRRVEISKLFPLFVIGFLLAAVLRSVGDATLQTGLAFGVFDAGTWQGLTEQIGGVWGSRYLLGTALAAVGLGTDLSLFRRLGLKPFLVSLIAALAVGLVGFSMAWLLGPHVHL